MDFEELIASTKRAREGAKEAFSHGREDFREALKRGYVTEGRETDGSRINQMLGSNRTISMARELMGTQRENETNPIRQLFQAKPAHVQARKEMGLGLSDDRATRAGQVLGTLGSDLVQDRGRELWWLINAPQALASVAQELALHKNAPGLYEADLQVDKNGVPISSDEAAGEAGLIDANKKPKAGVQVSYEDIGQRRDGKSKKSKVYRKRRHPAGLVETLIAPAGYAVNTGIGLMTPFGGAEGYKAVFEDPEDPTKTSNVLGEVAAKYILGKTGNLLPWDEFKKVRPDVSKDEYMRYKAFKFDNEADLNPFDDGTVVLPTGILKATTEGIHGPEVQFLGRSLPVTTAIFPTMTAIGGTAYGARGPMGPDGKRRGSVGRGLIGGTIGALGGQVVGNLFEQERRRRNAAENELDTIN